MQRRRFLSLCAGGVTGIWLAGTGFIQLTRQMVLKCSRPCSFCGKPPFHAFGLAGIAERDASICDDCISLCLDIIAEESHKSQKPASTWTDPDDLDALLRDHVPDESLRRKIELELETARTAPPFPRVKVELSCSFCDKHQRDVAKLIAGPKVYICDGCIGDAAAILLRPERLA